MFADGKGSSQEIREASLMMFMKNPFSLKVVTWSHLGSQTLLARWKATTL